MAKKKKSTVTRRRSRVGAIGTGNFATLGGIAVGALAARMLASKVLSAMDPKITSGIQLAAGVILAGQKNPMIKGVGLGMFGSGVIAAGQSFNLIAGVNRSSYMQPVNPDEMPLIAGYQGLNYLGNPQGSPEMNVISGLGNPQGDPELAVIAGMESYCS